jgi:hypothetical protein
MTPKGMSVFVSIGAKMLPSISSTATAVEKTFAKMTRSMNVMAAETKVRYKEMAAAIKPLTAMALAGGLSASMKGVIGDGFEYSHEISQMKLTGKTSIEMAQAISQANRTMRDLPTSVLSDNLKVLNETTMAFGSFEHAAKNLTFVQKMGTMLDNMLGDKAGDRGDNANNMIRAMEMRGMGTKINPGFDATRFQGEASQLYQAMIATAGRVNPAEFLGYMQQANPYMKGMSNRYLYRIAPSLMQEFGGDKAGTMQNTWTGTILGKAKNKISTEAWMRLGLLDPKQVVYNKVGPVGWQPGAIKGTDLALKDPLMWTEKILKPALLAHGFKTNDQLSLAKALMPLFRDRNANRLANNLVGDQDNARLHKDEGLIGRVPNLNRGYRMMMANDPKSAWSKTTAATTNLETTLGKVAAGPIAKGLDVLNMGLTKLADIFDKHPALAKGVDILMGIGAAAAGLKLFSIGLKIILSPLSLFGGALGKIVWAVGSGLGRLLLTGLMALAPTVIEGIVGAFALLSNPIGWAIILVAVVAALGYYFRDSLTKVWNMFGPGILAWGSGIIDNLIAGLKSNWNRLATWFSTKWAEIMPAWLGGGTGPAVVPGRTAAAGTAAVIPKGVWHGRGGGGDVHIHAPITVNDAHDAHKTAQIVDRHLRKMAGAGRALLSD